MRPWFAVSLVLSALLLGTTFSHTLEAIPKFGYTPEIWTRLQQTLYGYYAVVGGIIEVGANLSATVTAYFLRGRKVAFFAAVAGSICFAIAFLGIWVFITRTVNAEVLGWSANSIPANWTDLRAVWEYSHIGRFVLHLTGFAFLTTAILSANASVDAVTLEESEK